MTLSPPIFGNIFESVSITTYHVSSIFDVFLAACMTDLH